MAAKAAGELPQASKKDLELQETYRKEKEAKALAQAEALQAQNGVMPRKQVQIQNAQNGQAAQTK